VLRSIHQVLVGAAPGDAITEMARRLRTGLRELAPSEIYAFGIDPGTDPAVRPISELPEPQHGAVLVYHSSYGLPEITRILLHRRQPIVLVHHNVTPAKYFIDHDPRFAAGLEWARVELTHLRSRVALPVAVSDYNRLDLETLGYRDVRVIPAGVDPHRLMAQPSDPEFARMMASHVPGDFVIGVSQLLPHKRQDTLIAALHLVQHVHGLDLGLALVGPSRNAAFTDALRRFGAGLRVRNLWIVGRTTDRQLATVYRAASLFVSTSEHEGVGIPPLEAMAFGVPVIARAAGAVPDTMRGGGILLPEDAGPELFAEAIVRIHQEEALRQRLVHAGYERASAVGSADSVGDFVAMVSEVLG
jgi:glycosyltransferase involved in cell wall biosynthesis